VPRDLVEQGIEQIQPTVVAPDAVDQAAEDLRIPGEQAILNARVRQLRS